MNITEKRNKNSTHIDECETKDILKIINQEDQTVPKVLDDEKILNTMTKLINEIVKSFQKNGHLIYVGAGTSGRLGVLDASECVPTFGVKPTMIQGLIAGGNKALTIPVEGAEDSLTQASMDLQKINLNKNDIVIGIAASGHTPYAISALNYANDIGCTTGSISCNPDSEISKYADFPIEAVVGPEVVTGSTRMKSGTVQKLILNMISTTAMIRLGKTYSNLMVDLQPTNRKLVDRAIRIISEAAGISYELAEKYFQESKKQPKVAILMVLCKLNRGEAEKKLRETKGRIADNIK